MAPGLPAHGGPRGGSEFGAHEFSVDTENDMYAALFQSAVESGDNDRFEAVCYLADGKPELYDTVSAYSFTAAEEANDDAIEEYAEYIQPSVRLNSFHEAGGAPVGDSVTFADKIGLTVEEELPAEELTADSDTLVFAGLRPDIDMSAYQTVTFADKMAKAFAEKPLNMNYVDTYTDNSDLLEDSTDAGDSGDEDTRPPPPVSVRGCGRPLPGFGKSGLLGLMVCVLTLLCAAVPIAATAFGDGRTGAAAAPLTAAAIGGVGQPTGGGDAVSREERQARGV